MRFLLCLPLLALVPACAFGRDTSTPQGQCEASANNDPAVREFNMRMLGGGGSAQRDLVQDRDDARAAALTRCLRANGLAPPGAVEKPYRQQ
jgi:hypothetical protein